MIYDLSNFLDDLSDAFYPMKHTDTLSEARWLALVKRKLSHFKAETLQAAAESIQTSRQSRSFPPLAEMIKACEKCAPSVTINPETAWVKPGDAAHRYRKDQEYWETCVQHRAESPLFARAAKENWHTALKSFMVMNRRLPTEGEIAGCRRDALDFLRAYEDCVRGGFPLARLLEDLGTAMMRRREELRSRLIGG